MASKYSKDDIKKRLVLALRQFYLGSSELPAEMFQWTYLSVDNTISALLMLAQQAPPHNHAQKINAFLATYPSTLEFEPRLANLNDYRVSWNKTRYEGYKPEFKIAKELQDVADRMFSFSLNQVAEAWAVDTDTICEDIEEQLSSQREALYFEVRDNILEARQMQIERYAERYDAPKLTSKLVDYPRFITTPRIESDAEDVNDILRKDKNIADLLGDLYATFIDVVQAVDVHRMKSELAQKEKVDDAAISNAMAQAADFRIIVGFNYHGANLKEYVKRMQKREYYLAMFPERFGTGSLSWAEIDAIIAEIEEEQRKAGPATENKE